MQFTISLTDEELILFSEIVCISHYQIDLEAGSCVAEEFIRLNALCSVDGAIEDLIRSLLREPLKSSKFRNKFNRHFEKHPHHIIRDIAWPWMNNLLIWEK